MAQRLNERVPFLDGRYAIAARDADARVRLAGVNGLATALGGFQERREQAIQRLRNIVEYPGFVVGTLIREHAYQRSLIADLRENARALADYLARFDRDRLGRIDRAMRPLIDDPDPEVRLAAYRALRLIEVLFHDDDEARSALLARALRSFLGDLGAPSAKDRDAAARALVWVPRDALDEALAALQSAQKVEPTTELRERMAYAIVRLMPLRRSERWPEPSWLW